MVFTGPGLHIIMFSVVWCMHNISRATIKNYFGFPTMSVVSTSQTRLFSQRRCIEAWNIGCRNYREFITCVAKTKALISYAVITMLICVFVFTHAKKQVLS